MSNLAFATPLRAPAEEQHPRHIEIVSSRAQRRARPRAVYAVVAVAGLFVLFIAQLLLSIVVSDGAYRIAALQTSQRDLGREQQALSEQLDMLSSPQNLATQAESLGMVLSNTNPVFLRLADGAILGTAAAADAGESVITGSAGSLVPNSLLGGVPLVTATPTVDPAAAADAAAAAAAAGAAATAGQAAAGAPATAPTPGSVPSNPTTLPSPVTR
ncbi:hypothetical protein GCM10027413_20880 [Conyzicola nivalis]|uniref:Cell division protein FtsL n=1 Tax=Conyzicola nivalis TaxID=1477021 RepID=A0A916SF05_9MICO|nr:hypothetical protein [Conyzicola nivalis]GGA94071.1 hypothetical protein GCM10010979_05740 [Conyzicola nivalis]